MSEYVSIKTSLGELLSAATGLITRGAEMDSAMPSLIAKITSSEGPQTWGGDDFADKFTKNYQAPPEDGDGPAANESVKGIGAGKNGLGASAQHLGNAASSALINYTDVDTSSGQDIDGLV